MKEITHCHNQRPIYEADSGELLEWNEPLDVYNESSTGKDVIYHPFIFDIETSAELGQRPILLAAYNTLEDTFIVLYSHGYQGFYCSKQKVEEYLPIEVSDIIVHNLSQSNFEKYILRPINEWNEKAKDRGDKNRISLVAHNAAFDIPMMGTPDDELLQNSRIGEQYEQAVQYKHVKMVGHRAGQFGQIHTFLDSNRSYESMHIPVGDTLVAAQALWIPGKLEQACEFLDVDMEVTTSEEHGQLNDEYFEYCLNDVIATYELYKKLNQRLENMFGSLPIEHIYSTASIGKHILKEMGYARVGYQQEAVDKIAPAYFGGRTDAEITGEIVGDLCYSDILSQYPTVSELTDVWDYMRCKVVTIEQIAPEELPEVGDLREQETWGEIANYYVKIKPKGATLPVRTPHLADTTKVVTSQVNSEVDLQYHYMDIVAAELIDGEQKFEIKSAWKVEKHGRQQLQSTEVAGVEIKPSDNVMGKCIQSRKQTQFVNKRKGIGNKEGKNETTKSLKISGNSLYGISAERIVKKKDGEKHDYASDSGFYNPHVATTITAGGRLMLAFGEHIAKKHGSNLVYCDTDSLVLPENVTDEVVNAFSNLNPYEGKVSELPVLEKEMFGNIYATGTKKYVFFNDSGEVLEYKEHGLGNYENLRGIDSDGYSIIERLWATIIYYDKGNNPLNIPILYDKRLNELVLWSFNASTVSMRQMVDKMTEEFIRYGDWLQSTLSYDNQTRYIALNLEEKEPQDMVCKVVTDNEEVESITQVEKQEMLVDETLKDIRDIVMKFVQDSVELDERPTVNVVNTKVVTKEATNRKDIFEAKLEAQFNDNMGNAIDMLTAAD